MIQTMTKLKLQLQLCDTQLSFETKTLSLFLRAQYSSLYRPTSFGTPRRQPQAFGIPSPEEAAGLWPATTHSFTLTAPAGPAEPGAAPAGAQGTKYLAAVTNTVTVLLLGKQKKNKKNMHTPNFIILSKVTG